jgi:hypothetical protein
LREAGETEGLAIRRQISDRIFSFEYRQKPCPARVSAKRISQNLDVKELKSKILRTKGLNGTIGSLGTVTASTMITQFNYGNKVRCHNGIVENFPSPTLKQRPSFAFQGLISPLPRATPGSRPFDSSGQAPGCILSPLRGKDKSCIAS